MAWKRKNPKDWKGEEDRLYNFLMDIEIKEEQVKKYTQYHIRIFGRRIVDVWAGSKKYFVRGSSGSRQYNNPEELKEFIV